MPAGDISTLDLFAERVLPRCHDVSITHSKLLMLLSGRARCARTGYQLSSSSTDAEAPLCNKLPGVQLVEQVRALRWASCASCACWEGRKSHLHWLSVAGCKS